MNLKKNYKRTLAELKEKLDKDQYYYVKDKIDDLLLDAIDRDETFNLLLGVQSEIIDAIENFEQRLSNIEDDIYSDDDDIQDDNNKKDYRNDDGIQYSDYKEKKEEVDMSLDDLFTERTKENKNELSESEVQNIINYFNYIIGNERKVINTFDIITDLYTNEQLKILLNLIPTNAKKILEKKSARYIKLIKNGIVFSDELGNKNDKENKNLKKKYQDLIDNDFDKKYKNLNNKIGKELLYKSLNKELSNIDDKNNFQSPLYKKEKKLSNGEIAANFLESLSRFAKEKNNEELNLKSRDIDKISDIKNIEEKKNESKTAKNTNKIKEKKYYKIVCPNCEKIIRVEENKRLQQKLKCMKCGKIIFTKDIKKWNKE